MDYEEYLEHYGVKGMKWGQRKAERGSTPRKTDRDARKDAEEFARAKQFYGQGAGTRRKLIKAKVEARSARDPEYKKAFDRHLGNQAADVHATKAVKERKRKDRTERTKKQSGALARKLTGEQGTQAAFAVAAAAGVAYLSSPQGRKVMNEFYNAAKYP